MISFLKLIRYKNLLMVFITLVLTKYALIHSFISPSFLTDYQFIILLFSIIFITASGYIINDIFDLKADKINKPNKVYIKKTISKNSAWKSYFLMVLIGVFLGVYLSFSVNKIEYSFTFIGTAIGLFLYSKYLKKLPLIGNVFVAILIGLSIFILYLFDIKKINTSDNLSLERTVCIYIIFSFLTTLIREIIKDIEDIDGDYLQKMKTLPIVIGRNRTRNIILTITLFTFVFTVVITRFLFENYKLFFWYSIIFISCPLIYFLMKLRNAKSKKEYHLLSNLMKIIMLFGILSMTLFQFI